MLSEIFLYFNEDYNPESKSMSAYNDLINKHKYTIDNKIFTLTLDELKIVNKYLLELTCYNISESTQSVMAKKKKTEEYKQKNNDEDNVLRQDLKEDNDEEQL